MWHSCGAALMCNLALSSKAGTEQVFFLLLPLTPSIALFIPPGATFRGLNPVLSLFPGPPTRWCHLGNSTELLYILFLLGQSLCQDSVASNSGIEGDFYFIQRQKQIFTEHLLYTGHGS